MCAARVPLVLVTIMAGASSAWSAEPPALTRARGLYNVADYTAAIEAAAEARRDPEAADTAAVVLGRAYLERYRQSANPSDLQAGHEALRAVRAGRLAARDHVELLVGLGQYFFLSESFGPAGELFDNALAESVLLNPRERLLLLDWWANALSRSAQARAFERIVARMDDEIRRDPASPVANYWLPVAARGAGDVERAWDVAMAGWVRSALVPETAYQMRQDLDRFVIEALVPELARARSASDTPAAAGRARDERAVREEWERLKQQWP
jgi:hypothetical protein